MPNLKPVGFVGDRELWNSYLLDDGNTLRVKLVLQTIERDLDSPDDKPEYKFSYQAVAAVVVGKNLVYDRST